MDDARITVERGRESVALLRAYRVFLDGQKVGRLGSSESWTINVSPGPHSLHVALDWTRSPSLQLDLTATEHVRVRCRANGNVFTAVFWGTFRPKRALSVELVSDSN